MPHGDASGEDQADALCRKASEWPSLPIGQGDDGWGNIWPRQDDYPVQMLAHLSAGSALSLTASQRKFSLDLEKSSLDRRPRIVRASRQALSSRPGWLQDLPEWI